MKSVFNIFSVLFVVIVFSISCSSPQKLLEKGDYYQAVLLSVDKLKKNPNNKKAQETLKQAYPLAVENLMDKLKKDKLAQPQFANTFAVYTYEDLNRVYEKIQQSPIAKQIIKNPSNFYKKITKIKDLAAEEQYTAGNEQLNLGTKENAKQANYYFQEADKFVKNYKDVSNKLDLSYNLALTHVLADFKPIHSQMYQISANSFYNEIEKSLHRIEQNKFVHFYTENELKKNKLNPDQYLKINFEDFIVGETHTTERIEKMQADSVKVGETTQRDGTKKNVYGTVKAEVSINHMEIISKGIVNLTILETNNNRALLDQNFPGEFVWFHDWGSYNGDERALTEEQINICRNRQVPPPPPQEMFVEFTKPILNQLNNKLDNFYKQY